MRYVLAAFLITQVLSAQPVITPTPEAVGPVRGENVGSYNVTNSFETGWRWSAIDGNLGKYRSDVNYRNGIRLLGSSLSVNSRDGHGRFFDEIVLNTVGLGNDPYQNAIFRAQKNGLYRYDMSWRLNEYYNPGLTVAGGQHLWDTRRRWQDHDVVLFPQSRFKLRAGYSRNTQTGPALSTIQLFDSRGSEFPLFADVRRQFNEYRVGLDAEVGGFKLTLLHRWDYYKEDTPYRLFGQPGQPGNNPDAGVSATQFYRAEPNHGSDPGWLVNLNRQKKTWAANGRFTYNGGRNAFILDETAAGGTRFFDRARQIVVSGTARKPAATGDFALSYYPGDKVTIVNATSIHNIRIEGNAAYTEFNNATLGVDFVNFRYLGIRTVVNMTDVHYRAARWIGFYGGYHFSNRRILTIEDTDRYEQDNTVHAGVAGIRLKLANPLTVNLDGEIDRADRPFTLQSDRNYHSIGARAEYRKRTVLLSAAYRQNYNTNSVSLFVHSSHARNYSANASWSWKSWLNFDAQYARLHFDSVSGIAFFAGSPRATLETGTALYLSNIHSGNAGVRFALGKRADLWTGYAITRDTGATFPIEYHSPLARLSLRISPKLRWNAGWQFYRYKDSTLLQNYRAQTGYTSLLWSF